jgi:hypothetical protein
VRLHLVRRAEGLQPLAALGKHQEELMDFGTPMDFYSGLFGVMLLHSLNFFYG